MGGGNAIFSLYFETHICEFGGFLLHQQTQPPPPPQTQSITTVLHRMRKENVSHRTLPSLVALSISIGVARDKNLVTTVSEKVLLILNSQH